MVMNISAQLLVSPSMGTELGLPTRALMLDRYRAIAACFDEGEPEPSEYAWLRFAAQEVVLCPNDPAELAALIRSNADELQQHGSWTRDLTSPMRFIVAALFIRQNLEVPDFLINHLQTIGALRGAGLSSTGIYETMAALIIHMAPRLKPFDAGDARRIRSLYDLMKKRHWWLTGASALPDCAALACCHRTPTDSIAYGEEAYDRLRQKGIHRGRQLQTAVHVLTLGELPVEQALERWIALKDTLEELQGPLAPERYGALSVLALLESRPEAVIRTLLSICNELDLLQPRLARTVNFILATNLTVLDMMRFDENLEPLRDSGGIDGMLRTLHRHHIASAVVLSHLNIELIPNDPPRTLPL
jgi:hypothetical protein